SSWSRDVREKRHAGLVLAITANARDHGYLQKLRGDMYTLFYGPGSAAMAPHAALEEIGAPYKLVEVDLKGGEHRRPEYLKLNPKGRVPALVVDGAVFTESAAILMHLADSYPEAALAPVRSWATASALCYGR